MYIQPLDGAWQFRQAETEEWLPAQVPGGVHTDLLSAGRIPDPFEGDNEKHVQWVAERDWEYRLGFTVATELAAEGQIWLVCDGLDTLATVIFNRQELGRADNMFRQYRWNVKPLLRTSDAAGIARDNELHITFASPLHYVSEKQKSARCLVSPRRSPVVPTSARRRANSAGTGGRSCRLSAWKDIRLEGFTGTRLEEVHLRQRHADGEVTVEARVAVQHWTESPLIGVNVRQAEADTLYPK